MGDRDHGSLLRESKGMSEIPESRDLAESP